ncbi:hypothetical protein JB92DRAFT_558863 [Gautieria morchelliformis]|nr:hypothetical protein JB92DRAFT_558863 [Gautieria morchelliformis]
MGSLISISKASQLAPQPTTFCPSSTAGRSAERERLAAIGHEQPGPLTEHGFGFEGGGMGAHNADDGNRFDAYGDMNGNGGTYGNADTNVDAFAAEDVYSYTDADANSVICTNNANAQAERSHEGERKSEKHQQPIISGLPGAATEGGGLRSVL